MIQVKHHAMELAKPKAFLKYKFKDTVFSICVNIATFLRVCADIMIMDLLLIMIMDHLIFSFFDSSLILQELLT